MENQPLEVPNGYVRLVSSKFQWNIENFSKLSGKCYSDFFLIGSHKWRVLIYPKGNNVNHLSIYLDVDVEDSANFPLADISLAVVNQTHNKYTVKKETTHQFTAEECDWGFTSFLPLSELNDPRKRFIVNDTCVVEAMVSILGVIVNPKYMSKTISSKPAEVEPQVEAPAEVVAPVAEMDPVAESMPEPETQTELDGQKNGAMGLAETQVEVQLEEQVPDSWTLVECEAPTSDEVIVSVPTTPPGETMPLPDYPSAGQLFEEGKHLQGVLDDKFEDVGGFNILKSQASLYKQIWLKYGHIASSQVLTDSYSGQVTLVTDIMNSIMDMHHNHLSKVSFEMIDSWERKIKMAEKLEFNVRWLREQFEDFKKDFYEEQKLKTALLKQDQSLLDAKARLVAAEKGLILAEDELKKAQENVSALVTRISSLLLERQQYLGKGNHSVLDGLF